MSLPKQNIPENQKNRAWAERCVSSIIQMSKGQYNQSYKDRICYNMYNGIQNEKDYEYLTKVGDKAYPAKLRFIPILRTKLDRLISEESSRPFKYRVYSIDQDSIKKKEDMKLQQVVDKIYQAHLKRYEDLMSTLQEMQGLQQQLQQDPNNMQAQMKAAELQGRIDKYKKKVEPHEIIAQRDIENVNNYFKYDYRTLNEEKAEKGVRYLIEKYDLQHVFNVGFKDALISDRETYFVDHRTIDEDPYIRRVNPMYFFHSTDDDATFVGEHEWVMEIQHMTIPQIIDEFKTDLSKEDLDELNDTYNEYMSNSGIDNGFISDYETSNVGDDCGAGNMMPTNYNNSNKIPVYRCRWISTREIKYKKSPNKHSEGEYFTHLVSDSEKPKKGEEVEIKYVNDVWEGVRIGANIYCRCRKCPVQLRSIDKIGKVENGYIGHSYNYKDKRPYSLIWSAKDIQMLYNIIYYHKELWIALSGVKGFIMDYSQIPEGMKPEEWLYYRKIGTAWIQSVRDGAPVQFNQFSTYDDTISDSISKLTEMLNYLDELAGAITGVTRQRMGQTNTYDPVKTTEMSIQNSSVVTELLFYRHELLKRKALNRLINIARLAWKEGKRGQYVLGDLGQEILNIGGDELASSEYEVFMSNSSREQDKVNEIKQFASMQFQKQGISLEHLVKLYDMDNLREMQKAIEKFTQVAAENAQRGQEAVAQAELQKEMALKDKDNQFQGMIEQGKNNIEMMKLELERQRLGLDGQLGSGELQQKKYDTDTERSVEMAYLAEEKRQADIENAMEITKMAGVGKEKPKESGGGSSESKKPNKEKIKDNKK